ncbi:MAG: hypothetical protein ACM3JJ_04200 [Hyphomicrobiales bacterium]
MKRLRSSAPFLIALLLLLLGGVACNKDNKVGPKPAQITGDWNATMVEYRSRTTPQVRVDLIALGGAVKVSIRDDHAWVYVYTAPGGSPDTSTGTWRLDGDLFKVQPTGFPWEWTYDVSLSGSTLHLDDADVEFDFDENGTPEMGDQFITLVR